VIVVFTFARRMCVRMLVVAAMGSAFAGRAFAGRAFAGRACFRRAFLRPARAAGDADTRTAVGGGAPASVLNRGITMLRRQMKGFVFHAIISIHEAT
jgi:hypothetical protein